MHPPNAKVNIVSIARQRRRIFPSTHSVSVVKIKRAKTYTTKLDALASGSADTNTSRLSVANAMTGFTPMARKPEDWAGLLIQFMFFKIPNL
jgi:hypothetical protein